MKKVMYIALALVCALSLTACRDSGADRDDPTIGGVIEDEKDRLENNLDNDSGKVEDSGDGEGLITDHDGSINTGDSKNDLDTNNGNNSNNNSSNGTGNNMRRSNTPRKVK